ncbi:TetR family transcriptional regulator [Streptomyces eurocidicus]|uniref:AcrR family transcriptional regulator n=1 Tax=Streptomyces eurocidicus TaxID=66423 RepID=A0A2N8NYF5_STREU|nr:TetR/AcrR family transcriptional regulator [Streptomyces eurocidicus]MBB5119933.1 AcrR family transcriptional regulator [Streptomyces eurocidicus]MBF6050949.1 TetR family transcriptional regulator [Streptomyces eurocidicus]PNE33793.1 TetR family transcriptional regulator [Streptomyces eurocidicus]
MRTVDPEQHARKRALILRAAAQEFALHGVDGTSTASVCRRAGIGSGTLFHYFPTKRALFHALFADDLPRAAAARERALAAGRPGDGLGLLVDHLLADLADPLVPGLLAAAVFEANRDEEFAVLVATDEALTRAALTTLLERMAADGHRLEFAPERVAGWILRLSDACYLAAGEEGFDPVSQTAELHRIVDGLVGRATG